MNTTDEITVDAPIERVWDVYSDVAQWPAWTASVTEVHLLDGDRLTLGGRARIKQPRLPEVEWTVTAIDPGMSWTWVTRSSGAVTTATHELRAVDSRTTHVTQTVEQAGSLGSLVGWITRRLTRRYLAMEAAGLKQRSEAGATTP